MRRSLAALPAAILTLFAVAPVHGQLLQPQSIRFEGTSEYTNIELTNAAGLKKGRAYTSDELNLHAQQLMATGIFEKVGYKFDGVDLVFTLGLNSQAYPVLLDNLPLDTGNEL